MQHLVERMAREVYFYRHCIWVGYAVVGELVIVQLVRMVTGTFATMRRAVVLLLALRGRLTCGSTVVVRTVLIGRRR